MVRLIKLSFFVVVKASTFRPLGGFGRPNRARFRVLREKLTLEKCYGRLDTSHGVHIADRKVPCSTRGHYRQNMLDFGTFLKKQTPRRLVSTTVS